MKRWLLSSVVLIGACLLIFKNFPSGHSQPNQAQKFATGSPEDPEARARFEKMRLQDPRTRSIPPGIRAAELRFVRTLPKTGSVALDPGGGHSHSRPLRWQQRGPSNISGRTRALAYDVSNPNIILAGGVTGGMWRSLDGGQSWVRTTGAQQHPSVTALVQDVRPGKTNVWYVGSGERKGNSASAGGALFMGDGIFKSTDGGASWRLLPATASGQPQRFDNFFDYVWNLATDASNLQQDEVYVATHNTIRRSLDGGATWQIVLGDRSLTSHYADVAVTSTGVVYAAFGSGGSTKGLWRSTDGAPQNWTEITPAGWSAAYNRIVMGIAPSNEAVVYFLVETPWDGALKHQLWRYTYLGEDGSGAGGEWLNLTENLPAFGSPVGNFDSQDSYDMLVRVHPQQENVVFLGGTNLYRSSDGFLTSEAIAWIGGYAPANNVTSYKGHHPDQHALAFHPQQPNVMLSGHDGGISITHDNLAETVMWDSLNHGYVTTQFYTIALDPATPGSDLLIGGMQDNGTWLSKDSDGGVPWTPVFAGDGAFCALAPGGDTCYVSVQLGTVFRLALDGSGHVLSSANVTPADATGFLFINPFVLDPHDAHVMYLAAGNRVWRNHDLSRIPASEQKTLVNWRPVAKIADSDARVTALGISREPANRLYYGTNDGRVYRVDNAARNQTTPGLVSGEDELPAAYINCIAVDPTDADRVAVVFSNYNVPSLFFSADGGETWQQVSGNLEEFPDGSGSGPSTRWMAIVPQGNATHYFVGTSTGLYSTTSLDGPATVWIQEGATTIGNAVVAMVAARLPDGLVVAATHGRGVFAARLAARTNVEFTSFEAELLPGTFDVRLAWRTAAELNTAGFEIERREDNQEAWATIGFVPGTGTVAGGEYVFVDDVTSLIARNVAEVSYRLKHVSQDGTAELSHEIVVPVEVVPVALVDFSGDLQNESLTVRLEWHTALEVQSKRFLIERRGGSGNDEWHEIGVRAGQGTTDEPSHYLFAENVAGLHESGVKTLTYRLMHETSDGRASVLGAVEIDLPAPPSRFALQQNYPNPFNPTTRFVYELPAPGHVKLEIYNLLGQSVAILVNEEQSRGRHTLVWDASQSGLASGVYFYRIEVTAVDGRQKKRTDIRKLVFAK
ncbi:MAG: T9SS type A sorting domain-containing protein [bacterium]